MNKIFKNTALGKSISDLTNKKNTQILIESHIITINVWFIDQKKIRMIFQKIKTSKKIFHSMIKNISLKCNFTIQKFFLMKYVRVFEKYIYLNKKRAFVMIEFKTTNNFISQRLIDKFDVKRKFKKISYNLIILNEKSLSNDNDQILYKIESITLMMNNHKKQLFLNIIQMINHNIVLKFFWLQYHSLFINWIKNQFKFERCNYVITYCDSVRKGDRKGENVLRGF